MTRVTVEFPQPLTVAFEHAGDPPADPAAPRPAARTVSGLGVPFGVASGPSLDGVRYQFDGPPANLADLVDVVRGHNDDAVVGRLAQPWAPGPAGMPAVARIFATTSGNDLLEEAREGVLTGFSVQADIANYSTGPTGVRLVPAGAYTIQHLGIVRRPAFTESAGLTVAASHQEGSPMNAAGTLIANDAATTAQIVPLPTDLPTLAELAAAVRPLLDDPPRATHVLAQLGSYAEYAHAVADAAPERAHELQAAFAVADQITTDNPGVIPPGWRTDVKMNLDARRPLITGTGGPIPLPDAGMDANWPYFDGDLDAIIGKQTAEKVDLSGPKVSIKKATEPIHTAGAVSDISYQLILRSSPSYLDAYNQIMNAAWARWTEAQFEAALETRATVYAGAGGAADADAFRALLFELSAAVEDATGTPASVVGVAKDLWLYLGGLTGLNSPEYGVQNVAGTSSAATLRINVNGLEITRAPFLSAGTLIATNGSAARFAEQGPLPASSEDVRKLGRDVAVWGMYEDAEIYFPTGVIKAQPAVPVP